MTVSGFTFIRNAQQLYIPLEASLRSLLPLVDELVIALGDSEDDTEAIIQNIGDPKIKLIHTTWDTERYTRNTEYAHQTDLAKAVCTGDWLLYLQGDEVLHEQDYAEIRQAMQDNLPVEEVEGLLFQYHHFWGDYNHVHRSHAWYKREIRIIRNRPDIHSWRDAQSFRVYDDFKEGDYSAYLQKEGTRKLRVVELQAHIYHYGFVRPPHYMSSKSREAFNSYHGSEKAVELLKGMDELFDYGPLNQVATFEGTHPQVMEDWMRDFYWEELLQYSGKRDPKRPIHGHEKWKNRLLSWVENRLNGGKGLFEFKNFELLK